MQFFTKSRSSSPPSPVAANTAALSVRRQNCGASLPSLPPRPTSGCGSGTAAGAVGGARGGASLLEVWRRNIHGISRIIQGMRGRSGGRVGGVSPHLSLAHMQFFTIFRSDVLIYAISRLHHVCYAFAAIPLTSFVDTDKWCRCQTSLAGPIVTTLTRCSSLLPTICPCSTFINDGPLGIGVWPSLSSP